MADYDELFDAGVDGEYINTVIEIPKGSMNKVEYDREKKVFVLDRVEPGIFAKPVNYGFIPQTTDEDGDALDTLLITDEPITTGVVVKAKVVAVLNFVDGGEKDFKIICVPEDDRHWGSPVADLADLSDVWKAQIEHHFNHYKDLKKPGTTVVEGWGDAAAAWKVIADCKAAFSK
jgi:inorganic pyrophosphatase